jgi:hypothetical protein
MMTERSAAGGAPGLDPLPKRVRLANLVTELREPRSSSPGAQDAEAPAAVQDAPPLLPRRSGAAIGAFQRQSRLARSAADDEDATTQPTPGLSATREGDGR